MPLYDFKDPLSMDPIPLEKENDQAAWSEAVLLCGEMLKELNGSLPSSTDWLLTVHEGKRRVVTIRVEACHHERPTIVK